MDSSEAHSPEENGTSGLLGLFALYASAAFARHTYKKRKLRSLYHVTPASQQRGLGVAPVQSSRARRSSGLGSRVAEAGALLSPQASAESRRHDVTSSC